MVRVHLTAVVAGAALAVFQAAWMGILPPVFGAPSLAGSWVGCAMLVGLVCGTFYASRRDCVIRSGSRMPGLFQAAAGASAFAALLLVANLEGVYAHLVPGFHGAALSSLVGGVVVTAVLFVPNFLLGAGLLFECSRPSMTLALALLGGSAGALASSYVLVPSLGAFGAGALAAGCVGVAGCVAVLSGPRGATIPAASVELSAEPEAREGSGSREEMEPDRKRSFAAVIAKGDLAHALPAAAVVSVLAFSLVACAIVWMKIVGQAIGSMIYARTAVTGISLAAVGLGSLVSELLAGKTRHATGLFGLIAGLSGLAWLGLVFFTDDLGFLFLRTVGKGPANWQHLVRGYLGVGSAAMFLPCLIVGSALPLAWKTLASPGTQQARRPGGFILAALVGWLAACLVGIALPSARFSFRTATLTFAWIAVGCGVGVMVYSAGRRWRKLVLPAGTVATAVALSLAAPRWDQGIMTAGFHNNPEKIQAIESLRSMLRSADVVFYEENPANVTAVLRSPDGLSLKVSGTEIAASADDLPSQVLGAQIPLILAHEPVSVLVLGLATGITLGSAETHQVNRLECVEANPSALAAARRFGAYNHNALQDGRLDVMECDPANYLLVTRKAYDVVISQQPIPGKDLARLARARLSPAGVFCQMAQISRIGEAGLMSLAKEMAYYFPHVDLWWAGGDRLLLVASLEPLRLTSDALIAKLTTRRIKADLSRLGTMDDAGLLSLYMMDREALLERAGGVRADSRARSFLTYDAPKQISDKDAAAILARLDAGHVSPAGIVADLDTESLEFAMMADRLERCLAARTTHFRGLSAARDGRLREAAGYFEGAASNCPENGIFGLGLSDFCVSYSRTLMQGGRFSDAVTAGRRAVEANSDSYRALYNLATLEAPRNPSAAQGLLKRAVEINPDYLPAYLLKAQVEITAGEVDLAGETLAQVLSIEPLNIGAHHLRALCFIRRDLLEDARADLEFVLGLEPENTAALSALAYTWLVGEDLDKAQEYYQRALKTDPQNLEVLNNLATVYAEKRQYFKAINAWERALKLDPGNKDIQDNLKEARQKIAGS